MLKGPQSLFFGKNATAGLISLRSADPGPELEVIARAGYKFNAQQAYTNIFATEDTDHYALSFETRA